MKSISDRVQTNPTIQAHLLGLQPRDWTLLQHVLQAWATRRAALRHQEKSISRDIAVIHDFVKFSGLPPWLWQESEFEQWCTHIGVERKLAVASQRHYQSVIRKFLNYLCENVKFRNDIHRAYHIEVRQICNEENCIPHTVERELAKEKRALTHEEIARFFDAIDHGITEAARFHAKDLRPLQRDKALFFTLYVGGLRISEGLGLNTTSFQPNPNCPELGPFGFIHVWGKGSRGSGKRFRDVPVTHLALKDVLDWYLRVVRPDFLSHADPNETALFLSERGARLKISTAEARFQKILTMAGLDGLGLTPHCLRHSSVTHESLRLTTEAVVRKHGHSSAAVTQLYLSLPDRFVEEEITRVVANQIDTALKSEER
jgi:site-specific recombinase XerD